MSNDDKFTFYGVKEASKVGSVTDSFCEEISVNGYTVVEGVLDKRGLDEARSRIDEVYDRQTSEIGGQDRLVQMNDAFVGRGLLAYDEYFLGLATNAEILQLVERLLGDYFIISLQNAIINSPNQKNYQTSWHRDLTYQHFVASRPIAISALFCIDHFSEETGGTYVLPASHKTEKFPSKEFVQKHEKGITAQAGSAILFDSMLFHRAGYNRSQGMRRGINHMYVLPFIKQQISLPQLLNGKYEDDAFLNKFLGYESEPAGSVIQWRTNRFEKKVGLPIPAQSVSPKQ